ncbi:MAG: SlyX family protein [Deltaproteobacteria bacterium]|nr:SlyX family protein [Deltaproteobacteria bacterium]
MEERITELETLVGFQEQTLERLSADLLEQGRVIVELERRLHAVEEKLGAIPVSPVKDEADESPPPHY